MGVASGERSAHGPARRESVIPPVEPGAGSAISPLKTNYATPTGLKAAAWYWHFVDVVWLFLFTFVYWWASWNAVALQG